MCACFNQWREMAQEWLTIWQAQRRASRIGYVARDARAHGDAHAGGDAAWARATNLGALFRARRSACACSPPAPTQHLAARIDGVVELHCAA